LVPPPPPKRERSRTGRIIAVVVALLAAAAAAVVLLILTSGNSSSPSSTNASHRSSGTGTGAGAGARRPPAFSPKKVTVAVLNGTASQGLAGRTSHRLAAAGYKAGTVATAANQTETTTMVAYLPGYRADAMRVAAALKLSAASVQPISQTAQAVACPPPAACTANVVVTVGADLASP
jgi:hypothetical protein